MGIKIIFNSKKHRKYLGMSEEDKKEYDKYMRTEKFKNMNRSFFSCHKKKIIVILGILILLNLKYAFFTLIKVASWFSF